MPHSARDVYLKGGIGEYIKTVGIRITFGVVASLNAAPERSKTALECVLPPYVILGVGRFTYLDGINICEVIVDQWGGIIT